MKTFKSWLFILLILFTDCFVHTQTIYFPERHGTWQEQAASSFNIDSKGLTEVINFAKENEYSGSKDLRIAILKGFAREPFHEILGPTKKRGGPAGLIIKNGYIIGKWGDTKRVDMTFSVTKSFLSTTQIGVRILPHTPFGVCSYKVSRFLCARGALPPH